MFKDVVTVKDVVTKLIPANFPKIRYDQSVFEAVEVMGKASRGSVMVVDESDKFMGIFTERDYVSKIFQGGQDATSTRVDSVMTPRSECDVISPSTTIGESREIMLNLNRRRIPIVRADDTAVGVISVSGIIRGLQDSEKQQLLRPTVKQAVTDARIRANELASGDSELAKQDIFRGAFVVAASVVGAGLIQGDWIHNHEYVFC
jgi:CBS domain-containing protein